MTTDESMGSPLPTNDKICLQLSYPPSWGWGPPTPSQVQPSGNFSEHHSQVTLSSPDKLKDI